MKIKKLFATTAILLVLCTACLDTKSGGHKKKAVDCSQFNIDVSASTALVAQAMHPSFCQVKFSNNYQLPDSHCTPGAINPSVTLDVLKNPAFRTACLRNNVTNEKQKAATYNTYAITHPQHNQGDSQTCELDHLVPLELGGADTLDNIWPQCGPDGVDLNGRFFKHKDLVENYLTHQVKAGAMPLYDAQLGIAKDWTQYLQAAKAFCKNPFCD